MVFFSEDGGFFVVVDVGYVCGRRAQTRAQAGGRVRRETLLKVLQGRLEGSHHAQLKGTDSWRRALRVWCGVPMRCHTPCAETFLRYTRPHATSKRVSHTERDGSRVAKRVNTKGVKEREKWIAGSNKTKHYHLHNTLELVLLKDRHAIYISLNMWFEPLYILSGGYHFKIVSSMKNSNKTKPNTKLLLFLTTVSRGANERSNAKRDETGRGCGGCQGEGWSLRVVSYSTVVVRRRRRHYTSVSRATRGCQQSPGHSPS